MTSTYVITGASRGLGLEFVKQVSAQGHTVIALARNPDASKNLQKLIDNKKVFAFKLDVLDKESIKNAVKEVNEASPEGIDCLINNVGIYGNREYDILNTPGEEYLEVFNTNVVAVSNVTQAFLPLLRKRGQENLKRILNISSLLGSISSFSPWRPDCTGTAYLVSKCALNMLTKIFSNKLASENFIVYAANPGWVKTDMGGEQAPIEACDSISDMLKVFDNVSAEQSGALIDSDGQIISW
ncbi:4-dihydrotrisporin dehydrogenase [Helicostylum pulchrum]|nr:4-dihydrotrisporin dehydrogenase [Helicostylum pulchrum]